MTTSCANKSGQGGKGEWEGKQPIVGRRLEIRGSPETTGNGRKVDTLGN